MRLGAHVSTAGGVAAAFDRAVEVTAKIVQVFTRNQNQWKAKPLAESEIARFRARRAETGIGPNMSHASYLVNLASSNPELAEKSVAAMADEMCRADQLGIEYLVFHPGSHLGIGVEAGLKLVAERLDRVIEMAGDPAVNVTVLLETTAGQGTNLGFEFCQLSDILARSRHPDRLGVCFDTCHAFAAGYDISTKPTYEETMRQLIAAVTLDKIKAFHFNDCLKDLASRIDRHAGIGQGKLGLEPFGFFINDPRFAAHPAALETPEAEKAYKAELTALRGLLRK